MFEVSNKDTSPARYFEKKSSKYFKDTALFAFEKLITF